MMNESWSLHSNIWSESGGPLLRDLVRLEARKWHLLHRPPPSLAGWTAWREALREQIRFLAGLDEVAAPLDAEHFGTVEMESYTIHKLTYQSRPGFRVTANLYKPHGDGPFPAVLGTHGHWSQGKVAARVASRGHVLAQEGFVVLVVDAFGSGERSTRPGEYEYHGKQLGASLLNVGKTLLGMQIHDNMRGVDYLQSLPYVDGERIGVTGASGGGNQTMWLAAMDDRIKASVPVVSVGTFESYVGCPNCICETLPQGLTFMEEWGVLGLAAPNSMLILNALQDTNPAFNIREMLRSYSDARRIYRFYDAEESFAYRTIDLPHGYWPEMQRHMLGWFRRFLKGEGSGWPCDIPECPELPEEKLLCFPDLKRPPSVQSILDFVAAEGERLMGEQSGKLDRQSKRQALAELLHLPTAPSRFTSISNRGTECVDGVTVHRFIVESEPGVLLPCLGLFPHDPPESIDVCVHPMGKELLVKDRAIRDMLEAGKALCLVDLRNTGETHWDDSTVARDHEAARAALWLGRTVIGDWAKDLLAVRAALAEGWPGVSCSLTAYGDTALAGAAAAALGEGFTSALLIDMLSSWFVRGEAPKQSMNTFVPGILAWGDVSLIIAMAPIQVGLRRPVDASGEALTQSELSALQEEIRHLAKRLA